MNRSEQIIQELYKYYKVSSLSALAKKMNTSHSSISRWKNEDNEELITKRLFELGIYDEIIGGNVQLVDNNTGINSQNNYGNNTMTNYELANIDSATLELFKEAYSKAEKENSLKDFRIYLMSF